MNQKLDNMFETHNFYSEEEIELLEDEDILAPGEAGFMMGYLIAS